MSKKLLALCLSVAMVIAAMSGVALLTDAGEPEVAALGGFGWNNLKPDAPVEFGPAKAYKFDNQGAGCASYNNKDVANALGMGDKAEGYVVDLKVEMLMFWDQRDSSNPQFQVRTFNAAGEVNDEPRMNDMTGNKPGKWVVYTLEKTDAVVGKDGQDDLRLELKDRNDKNTIYIAGVRFTATPKSGEARACQWGTLAPDYGNMNLPAFSWQHDNTTKATYDGFDVYKMANGDFSYNGAALAKWMGLNKDDVVDLTISLSYFWETQPDKGAAHTINCETVAPDGTATTDRGRVGMTEAGMTAGSWQTKTFTREGQVLGYPEKDDWYFGFNTNANEGETDTSALYIRGIVFSAKLADDSVRTASFGVMSEETVDKSSLQEAVDNAKTDLSSYTEASAKDYTDALNAANAVLENDNATAQDVADALKNLADADAALVTKEEEPAATPIRGFCWTLVNGQEMAPPVNFAGTNAYLFGGNGDAASYNAKVVANALGLGDKDEGYAVDLRVEALVYWDRGTDTSDPKFQFRTFDANGAVNNDVNMTAVTGGKTGQWVVYTLEKTNAVVGKTDQDDLRLELLEGCDSDRIYIGGIRFMATPAGGEARACQWGILKAPDFSHLSLPDFSWKSKDPLFTSRQGYEVLDMSGQAFSYNEARLAKWMGLTSDDPVDLTVTFSYYWDEKKTDEGNDWMKFATIDAKGAETPERGACDLSDAGMTPGSWQTWTMTRENQRLGWPGMDDWYLSFDILNGGSYYIRGLVFSAKLADGSVRSVVWGTMEDRDFGSLELPAFSWRHVNTTNVEYDGSEAYRISKGDFSYNKGELAKHMGLSKDDVVDLTISLNYFWETTSGKPVAGDTMSCETIFPNGEPTPDRGIIGMVDAGMKVGRWDIYTFNREKQVMGYPGQDDWYFGFDTNDESALYIRGIVFSAKLENGTVITSSWGVMERDEGVAENELTFAENNDVTMNEDGALVFPGEWKSITLENNTDVIPAGEKELTVEVQYTLDAAANVDDTFANELFILAKGEGAANEASFNPGTVTGAVRDGKTVMSHTLKLNVNYGTDSLVFKYGNGTKLNLTYAKVYATDAPEQYLVFGTKHLEPPKPPVGDADPIIVIDTMDSDSNYNGTLETNYKKQGAGAVINSGSKGSEVSVNSNDNALNVLLPENWLEEYYVELWIYVSKASAIGEGSCFELSQVMDSVEIQYGIPEMELRDGWNKVQLKISEMNQTAVDQMSRIRKIRFFCLNLSDDLTIALDDIVLTRCPGAAEASDFGKQQITALNEAIAAAKKVDTSKASQKLKDALEVAQAAANTLNLKTATARDVQVTAEALAAAVKAVEDYKPATTTTDADKPTTTETDKSTTTEADESTTTEANKSTTTGADKPTATEANPSDPDETDPAETDLTDPSETEAPMTTESLPNPTETGETSMVLPMALLAVAAAAVSAVALKKKERQ